MAARRWTEWGLLVSFFRRQDIDFGEEGGGGDGGGEDDDDG